ncbi:MAG: glycosyltransferase family 4 protein [Acidobacteriia bacterium]|nr:glycosyltransferase family 4 protein [Terriglobia bacterium]
MIHLFVNGIAASAGGGLTYLRNVIPHLAERTDVYTSVAVNPALREEFGELPRVSFVSLETSGGAMQRFWREQTRLASLLRSCQAQVLISAGNFALWRSPVPQILLSRNSLYTSGDFYRDLRSRGEYRMWLDTRVRGTLAKLSIHYAERTIAPSKAFADELRRWAGVPVVPIYHGFDRDLFLGDSLPLSEEVERKLGPADGSLRLLFVSHYTYYRNFETLIRALPLLKKLLAPRRLRLTLTCEFHSKDGYRTDVAAALLRQLDVANDVVQLGPVPYRSLSHLYQACDVYVTPAYTETFAHPLVEAMASGLPIVASDLPVHREICGSAALYFPRFSPDELAQRIMEVVSSAEVSARLADEGKRRSQSFSWSKHVGQIVALAGQLIGLGG